MKLAQAGNVAIPANISDKSKVFSANQYVNSGVIKNINFVVYVDHTTYSQMKTDEDMREVGHIVGRLNQILPKKEFVLIGPGRWGSKGDIKLGVPITYADINNTSMLIEVAREKGGYVPELSFGTHFFQDLVEADIRYLPLYPDQKSNLFNDSFFYDTPNSLGQYLDVDQKFLDCIRLITTDHFQQNSSLAIHMNGATNEALAYIEKTI
jgi:hypothetical protein